MGDLSLWDGAAPVPPWLLAPPWRAKQETLVQEIAEVVAAAGVRFSGCQPLFEGSSSMASSAFHLSTISCNFFNICILPSFLILITTSLKIPFVFLN